MEKASDAGEKLMETYLDTRKKEIEDLLNAYTEDKNEIAKARLITIMMDRVKFDAEKERKMDDPDDDDGPRPPDEKS